jgi:hypothetical protein
MRHEHKMFIGIFPLILLLGGLIWGKSKENETIYVYMSWMIILIVSTTLSIGGFSFWYLLHKLPLFNSIRAVTRIDQALLLPSAYLAAIFVDRLSANFHWGRNAALVLIVPGLLLEANTVSMITSSKMDWERRIDKLESSVPSKLSESPVFFFAQRDGPNYADEIDAMWVSMNHGVRTLNGYSGLKPPNYSSNFGRDCSELPKRILSYLEFIDREGDLGEYKRQISKVIPIGFSNCDPSWFNTPPETTKSLTAYSPDQFKALNFKRGEIYYNSEKQVMTNVIIENPSEIKFSVLSETNHPIKVSWRYLDPSGKPLSGYDTRENIRFDIPAHGNLAVSFPLVWPSDKAVSAIQISIVQEGLFWGHDIGIEPLVIKLDKIIG